MFKLNRTIFFIAILFQVLRSESEIIPIAYRFVKEPGNRVPKIPTINVLNKNDSDAILIDGDIYKVSKRITKEA